MSGFLKKRLVRWPLYVIVLLALLYCAVLPVAVTYWGRGFLADQLSQATHSKVTIGSLYFNPFSWDVSLNQLAISRQDKSMIKLQQLRADLSVLPLLSHQVYLHQLELVAPQVHLVRLADGKSVNLQSLAPTPDTAKKASKTATEQSADNSSDWSVRVVDAWLNNGAVTFTDNSVAGQPSQRVTHIDLHLHEFTLDKNQPFAFSLSLLLPATDTAAKTTKAPSKLTIEGDLGLLPLQLHAKAQVSQLALTEGNPWLQGFINGSLASGRLNANAEVQLPTNGALQVAGHLALDQLTLNDAENQLLVQFDKTQIDGIKLQLKQRDISIEKITLAGLAGHFERYDDGGNTLSRLLVKTSKETHQKEPTSPPDSTDSKANPESTAHEASTKTPEKPWHFHIGGVQLDAKQLLFNDQTVTPDFNLKAKPLTLVLGPLDNTDSKPLTVNIDTKLDGYSPLKVQSDIDLFDAAGGLKKALAMSVKTQLKNYDMTRLTPFVSPIVGYKVKRGHLNVTSDVTIKGTVIDSNSTIDASDFHLGGAVPAKQALKVPVKFGLTVLRDRHGNISLPLNMAGNLADPSVNIHGLVVDTLLNVLKKAATSPFSLLSKLYGSDLNQVQYATASTQPTMKAVKPIGKLLQDKPSLQLGISGRTNAKDAKQLSADGKQDDALKAALLELAQARAKALRQLLVEHYAIDAKRIHLEQAQTDGSLSGVILSLLK